MLLGIDIGGTFTDFLFVDDAGHVTRHKRLTTPADPAQSLLEGIRELAVPANALVVHGSTIATNALLERHGARTALITTAGFADVIEIGRQNRPDLYALVPQKPPPLVPRQWRYELHERVSAQGDVLLPLDPAEIDALLPQLHAEGIESVAVCFLFSFLQPEHERMVKEKWEVRGERSDLPPPTSDLPPLPSISLSSEVLPEYREYERLSSTVINAYVQPLMERYLARLERGLSPRPLRIMQSNGGCITSATARVHAARTVLSGPAGGVVGAFEAARQLRLTTYPMEAVAGNWENSKWGLNIITFDMGGTSTDVCLCPGHIPFTSEGEIGGLPLRLPIIDIHTVGAGGGSLARVDAGGALTVGPESAGADPGPACYGRGGAIPTVTDANLILNRLHPQHFLGGRMALDESAAHAVFKRLAADLPHSPLTTHHSLAWGVIQIANAAMERAIRKISVERGHDPRDFTLVAFGGAGPLHACELAERLSLPRVLIPRWPGVLSALGMALSDLVKDYAQTVMRRADELTATELDALFAPLEARARAEMWSDGINAPELQRSIDARYVGQSFEINIPFNHQSPFTTHFHALHAQRYGHSHPAQPIECVTLRVRAVGQMPRPVFEPLPAADAPAMALAEAEAWFEVDGALHPQRTALYEREQLRAGHVITGPAILFQMDATTVVPPGWGGAVDEWGHLLLQKS